MTSQRIKLQLFPINWSTQTGLEKDGYNPHLELTLRLNKKISSVIKHVNNKWGSSSVAKGELILFPYECTESEACYPSWNSSNDMVTAEHVHSLIGNPSIFRLRYGWCSDIPQPSMSVTSANFFPKIREKEECDVLNTDITYVEPAQPEDENRRDDVLWIYNENDVSVSDLFNEASLQGKLGGNGEPILKHENRLLEAISSPDSFDAAVAAQSNADSHLSNSRPSQQHSIFDPDLTSHEFPEHRFVLSSEYFHSLISPASGNDHKDAGPIPSHLSTVIHKDNAESKDTSLFTEHTCNEDVGGNHDITGIHCESLNTFDFPLPPWGFIMGNGGDNASKDFLTNQLIQDDH